MSTYINFYLHKRNSEEYLQVFDIRGSNELFSDINDYVNPPYAYEYNKETGNIESSGKKVKITFSQIDDIIIEHSKMVQRMRKRIDVYKQLILADPNYFKEYNKVRSNGEKRELPFNFSQGTDDSKEYEEYYQAFSESSDPIQEIIEDEEYESDLIRQIGKLEMLRDIVSACDDSWNDFDGIYADLT